MTTTKINFSLFPNFYLISKGIRILSISNEIKFTVFNDIHDFTLFKIRAIIFFIYIVIHTKFKFCP
jgi:hypothetical protein